MLLVEFQNRVWAWLTKCFSLSVCHSKTERNLRFLEEALELVQALGLTREECLSVVDYVYSRPVGSSTQEVGGVMVTLAALCSANTISLSGASITELDRCWKNIDTIRLKQADKPSAIRG